jgi:dUTP pyrophosphatase
MNEDLENQKKQLEELDSIFEISEEMKEEDFESDQYYSLLSDFGLDINKLSDDMDSYTPTMPLRYSSSNGDSVEPKYAYPTDSGFDLYSTEELSIDSFGRVLVPTGLHFDIPDGYEIQVRSKSGLALKQGLMVLNSPGTVDQGYTGEIKVIIFNASNVKVKIEKGQKIAQAVVSPVVSGKWINLVKVDNIEDKDRSDKGFGSTGI